MAKAVKITFKRAQTDEKKDTRRLDILDGAEKLLAKIGFENFTMNGLAKHVGLAKGTLYLYFRTKEELFLTIYGRRVKAWVIRMGQALPKELTDRAFAELYFKSMMEDPLLLPLGARLRSVMETDISAERFIESKRLNRQYLMQIAEQIEHPLRLRNGQGIKLIWNLMALAMGSYQMDLQSPIERKELPDDVNKYVDDSDMKQIFIPSAQLVIKGLRNL